MSKVPDAIGIKYMAAWKKAARVLLEVRARELRNSTDTTASLLSLLPAFEACVKNRKTSITSGLIDQQKIFSRFRIR